jgi:hypothetical protein
MDSITVGKFCYEQAGENAPALREITTAIRQQDQTIGNAVVMLGKLLIAAKAKLPHGSWSAYLCDECEYSERTARRLMQVAEVFGDETDTGDRFDTSALYALSCDSTPVEARREAIDRAAVGERITKGIAAEIVDRHRGREQSGLSDAARAELAQIESRIRDRLASLREAGAELKAAGVTFEQCVAFSKAEYGLSHEDACTMALCMLDAMANVEVQV